MEPTSDPGNPRDETGKTFSEANDPHLDETRHGIDHPDAPHDASSMGTMSMLPSGNEPEPLGSGTVSGLLGAGGMARVYKIWNEKLEVFRAVKILLPTPNRDLRNRFETETKISAKLHHPNIVEIYNVGEWNELPVLEMEFIDGDSLETIIHRHGKMPDQVCCSIAICIARALVYAHGQEFLLYGKNYHGIIHRDLKPANIMIAKNGLVKLMDFGIARPVEASLHTMEGNIVGTLQYLSPEQIDGINIDCRTDIYSLGAILYEMLTGTKTFPQETITNLMKKKIVNEYRSFSQFDFQVAPELADITQRCLQSVKEERYASADELLKELEAALQRLTNSNPDQILQKFFKDPAVYTETRRKKTASGAGSKRLLFPAVAAAAAIIVAGVSFYFLSTHSWPPWKNRAGANAVAKTVTPQQQPAPVSAVVDSAAARVSPTPPETGSVAAVRQVDSSLTKNSSGEKTLAAVPPIKPAVASAPAQPVSVAENGVAARPERKPALSVEQLQAKYNTTDPVVIVRNCIKSGKAESAIAVLESASGETIAPDLKTLLLFEAYIDANRTGDALSLANKQYLEDAQFDYLCGRLYQVLGRNESALDYFKNALTKNSVFRKRNGIRDDALYYTALVRSDQYRKDSSATNREAMQKAWSAVRRLYGSTPNHPRCRMAQEQLAAISDETK